MAEALPAMHWLHLLGASVLLGNRIVGAWLFERLVMPREPVLAARAARALLGVETLLVAPAVGVQLATGLVLAEAGGTPLATPWLAAALVVFAGAGVVWAPLLWSTWRMATTAEQCRRNGEWLPAAFERWLRIRRGAEWCLLAAVVALFWLMTARPGMVL